ncbi:hypothetical protein D9615_007681 [Tricholomella constricta]|uniref:Uncharacterized protein n=1 Tax=Tricholomella constricta TaxID=117010 RepID=A0A8H5H3K7_9AGAR|nr:hypothetical protein D9615_007681 [Tricholomella constricta]
MASPLPPVIIDLQARGVDFARRLGSLIHFVEAGRELQACRSLPSKDFRRHCRKIVTLIEIARKTLTEAGIKVHLFSPCPASLALCKSAYVDLLHMLNERRIDVDPALEERVKKLVFPLSSGFQIIRKDEPYPSPLPSATPTIKAQATLRQPGPIAFNARNPALIPAVPVTAMMPPPDAFPVAPSALNGLAKRREPKLPGRYWDVVLPPRNRRSSRRGSNLEDEQENVSPPPRLLRPAPRRFGIFCTGKTSMHQYRQPTPRPRTVQ